MKTTTSTQSYTFLRLPNFVQILNYQAPPQIFHLLPINIGNLKVKILERYLSKFILKSMRNKNFKIQMYPGDLIGFNSEVSKQTTKQCKLIFKGFWFGQKIRFSSVRTCQLYIMIYYYATYYTYVSGYVQYLKLLYSLLFNSIHIVTRFFFIQIKNIF